MVRTDPRRLVFFGLAGLGVVTSRAASSTPTRPTGQQRQALDNVLTSQSVMLMFTVALICAAAAFLIWLAPRPARAVDMTKAGH